MPFLSNISLTTFMLFLLVLFGEAYPTVPRWNSSDELGWPYEVGQPDTRQMSYPLYYHCFGPSVVLVLGIKPVVKCFRP